jgi:U3 small nucleolar RNA-associated protein 14
VSPSFSLAQSLQGAWGGQGTRKNPPKPHQLKKVAGIDPQSRADFGKAHVIISEKRDKKAAKYLTNDLPYPYTSKEQFERTLEMPIGREWNTRIATQRVTFPKVTKKVRNEFCSERTSSGLTNKSDV